MFIHRHQHPMCAQYRFAKHRHFYDLCKKNRKKPCFSTKIYIFTQATRKISVFRKTTSWTHRMLRSMSAQFFAIFLIFQNMIKIHFKYQVHMHLGAKTPPPPSISCMYVWYGVHEYYLNTINTSLCTHTFGGCPAYITRNQTSDEVSFSANTNIVSEDALPN